MEQGLGLCPAALGSVRHSQMYRLQHGPEVDTSPCHCRCRAASAMTNEPFVKESPEMLVYYAVSRLTRDLCKRKGYSNTKTIFVLEFANL